MSATATSPAAAPRPGRRSERVSLILVDAAVSFAAGLVCVAGAPVLDGALGLSAQLLAVAGLLLLAYAAGLVPVARHGAPTRAVAVVVALNAAWVVVSVVVTATDSLTLTAAGTAVVLLQAVAVALLAALHLRALRG